MVHYDVQVARIDLFLHFMVDDLQIIVFGMILWFFVFLQNHVAKKVVNMVRAKKCINNELISHKFIELIKFLGILQKTIGLVFTINAFL